MKKAIGCFLICLILCSLSGCGAEQNTPVPMPGGPAGTGVGGEHIPDEKREGSETGGDAEEPNPDERVLLSTVRIVTDNGQNGTGFAIDGGYIVTNYHVVWDSEDSITAATSDGTEHPAAIIGFDGMTDIAVLEIPVILEPLELGNSEAVLAGDPVTAIGFPDGETSASRAPGIVLEVDPDFLDLIDRNRKYLFYDGNAVSGFSGGPVYDDRGTVIGVLNNRYVGDLSAYDYDYLCGIIPVNTVKESIRAILENSKSIDD